MKHEPSMRRTGFIFIAQFIVLAGLLAGCGKRASDEIDFGTFTNSVYHNNFFGVSVTTPSGWSIQDQNAQQRLMKLGEKMIAGDDKSMKAAMQASEMQSVNLFAVYKYPYGSPVTNNLAIMSVAEKVGELPGIKRGKDYLFHVRQMLEASSVSVDFLKDIYPKPLGGVDFDVMELELHVRGTIVREQYYTTIMKGYALSFIVISRDLEMDPVQRAALDSVTFK